jgi:hypothetical protein
VVDAAAVKDGRTLQGLGITPQAMVGVVPRYLERFHPYGQFAHYHS